MYGILPERKLDREGELNAERLREIQRVLEASIDELDPNDITTVSDYLPYAWFDDESGAKLNEWRAKICKRYKELLVEEILEEIVEEIVEGDSGPPP